MKILISQGVEPALINAFIHAFSRPSEDLRFEEIMLSMEISREEKEKLRKRSKKFSYQPKISLIIVCSGIEMEELNRSLQSISSQIYSRWEIFIVMKNCSSDYLTSTGAFQKNQLEYNISYFFSVRAALEQCMGDYIGILHQGDELLPDSLYNIVQILQKSERIDFLYGDDVVMTKSGDAVYANFKPDYSPDFILSHPYIGNFYIVKKTLFLEIWNGAEESSDFDDYNLILNIVSHTANIAHIKDIIYIKRWKHKNTSKKCIEMRIKALNNFLLRERIQGEVMQGVSPDFYLVKRKIQGNPKVSIILSTRNRVDLLSQCISSIEKRSTFKNYEILIIDNQSTDESTIKYLDYLQKNHENYKIIEYPHKFNFSAINNLASRQAEGDHLIFLNNDVEVISPEWIESLLQHSQRKEVACVGAKLLYPDGTIQHAGVIIGLSGIADHIHKFHGGNSRGYLGNLISVRNYSAVTAACMMIKKDLFEQLGGFDTNFAIGFGDVDLCLRARKVGFLNVFTPYAQLYHYESATRGRSQGFDPHPRDSLRFLIRWHSFLARRDPYYNPHLPLDTYDLDPYVTIQKE